MKRINAMLALLLALLLACGLATAEISPQAQLPAVGDRIGGFVVRSVTPMDAIGATGVLFEHEKNGAQLLYLASDDKNVSFDISFRTPALDETGKPHVFEHMTICGSQKYPDANLFFPFYNQTYNTFVNALTYHGMTTYPVSSMSEDQLMTMMDYYLSGVFQPLLYTEPRLASREAWRYELNSAEDEIGITGTVYSEMQGALTINQLAAANSMYTLFQDSPVAHVSGGRPEAVRTLTYDDLIAFHDAYYHPSNSLIILYGAMDYERFIRYIDEEYVGKYDRKDVYVERGQIAPYTKTAYATYEAPVENGAQTEDASIITYDFTSNDMTMKDQLALTLLASVLSDESSAVMRLLNERLPGASPSMDVNPDLPAPAFSFNVFGVNESDRDVFAQAVDEGLAQTLKEGLSATAFDAAISNLKLALMLSCESATVGVNASTSIALYWAYFDQIDYFSANEQMIDTITLEDLTALLKKYLTENPYRAVTVTKPVAGLAEKNAAELSQTLSEKKAAMTDQDIADMVEQTKSFTEWSAAPVDPEILGKLVNMTVDQLPEIVFEGEIKDETADGVRYITSAVESGEVAYNVFSLDVSSLPVDKLLDAATAINLMQKLDTAAHTKEALPSLISRDVGILTANLSATASQAEGQPDRYLFSVTTIGLTENAEKAFSLIREILLTTDYSQIEDIKNVFSENLFMIRSALDNPIMLQMSRCKAAFSTPDAFNAYLGSINEYEHTKSLLALAESDPEALTARLESARDALLNRTNATVLCVGSENAVKSYRAQTEAFLRDFPEAQSAPVDYKDLKLAMTSEAIVNNSTVHMNVLAAPTEDYSGKLAPLSALINDKFMLPKLRNALGAYGAYSVFSPDFSVLYTYRDPNLAGTFSIFEALPAYLRTAELTQAEVDNYIIGAYGQLLPSGGKLSQAIAGLSDYWMGISSDTRLQWMREAKSLTVSDVHAAADPIEALLKIGVRSTSGAESVIEENKALFDNIVRLEAE